MCIRDRLRAGGLDCPILILGWTPARAYDALIAHDITTAIYNLDEAKALNQTAERLGKKAKIHIKVDTGMSRIGIVPSEEGVRQALSLIHI